MGLFDMGRVQVGKLKEPQHVLKEKPASVQDTIEIMKIAPNGIFQVAKDIFSKSYLLEDNNYASQSYDEQVSFFGEWCNNINSINGPFKITVFNRNRNMQQLRDDILYQHKNDPFDSSRDCFNEIIEEKIINGKQGIEQVKFMTIPVQRNNYEDAKATLYSLESNIVKNLGALGSPLTPLNANDRLNVLYNFYRCGDEDKFDINVHECISTGADWRNDLACKYINFNESPDYFVTDKKYCRAMYIDPSHYPTDTLSDEFFESLSNIVECSLFTIDYVPISKEATKTTLELKYMGVQEKIRKQQQKRNSNKDFSSEISYTVQKENDELVDMMDDVKENDQHMFWVSITIILIADSLADLERATSTVKTTAINAQCRANVFEYQQREALNTALPLGVRQICTMRSMFTRMAGVLVPFRVKEMQMKEHPFYYGANKISKNPILCNRKKLVNGNGFIFGVTGGGKSFTGAKLEIASVFMNTDDDIIILDPTLEYKDVSDSFGGTFIDVAPDSDYRMNPLHFNVKELNKINIKKFTSEKSQIMCGICEHALEKEFLSGHRSIIDRCIKKLMTNILETSVEERKVPIMSDFLEILKEQKEDKASDIILGMEVFIDGSMDIFNSQTNVDPENRIIVYGIRDIGEELESIAMLIILENIKKKIIKNAQEGRATWLYVDEFHVLMDKPFSKRFLISLWKKVRKLGGLCTGITQNVSDVVKDKETAKLLSNSEYTMFLRMGASDGQLIIDTFEGKISQAHLKYIENAAPGNGLIRFGNVVIPMDYEIEKSNPIYDIFNTNPYEKMAQAKAKQYESAS